MKKTVLIAASLFLLILLCGCKTEVQNTMNTDNSVTVINEIHDADVWILPKTEENLKTTVWGSATVHSLKGESAEAPLCEPGDDGLYLFRMIDTDGFYYSANDITLEDGCTLTVKETDVMHFTLEVTNSDGESLNTYDLFSAKL